MDELTANINWMAALIGAVISFLLGWFWYSPKLFGTKWAAGVGIKLESDAKMPMAAMLTQLLATFLLSWTIAVTAANNALLTAILIVVTIVAILVASGLFLQKSTYALATEGGFVVAMAIIMIICQGIF